LIIDPLSSVLRMTVVDTFFSFHYFRD
jgi:hypothetical protein